MGIPKKTIGFLISHKENEWRRALLPQDIVNLTHANYLYIEKGYGDVLKLPDEAYQAVGCQLVSRAEALEQTIICDPKIGEARYLNQLRQDQTIFGWIHAGANSERLELLRKSGLTVYDWSYMKADGRHSFWENNQLAGMAAVLDGFKQVGKLPRNKKVALIGRGNTAQGALKVLTQLGANVVVYNRNQEELFKRELTEYEVIVNAVMWDKKRLDYLISKKDLAKLKFGTLLIDISCDLNGAIETSRPTTIKEPTYTIDGVIHYVVDHTPSLLYQDATAAISTELIKYIDGLVEGRKQRVIEEALIIAEGRLQSRLLEQMQ